MPESVDLSTGAEGQEVEYLFHASAEDFKKVPGSPIAYWVSSELRNVFSTENGKVGDIANPNQALVTGNTERYIRKSWEVSTDKIGFGVSSRDESVILSKKWFPYNKGGDYRNWYGNHEHLINWENDGLELQTTLHPSGKRVWAHNFVLDSIFKEAIVWSKITSGKPCFRYSPPGFLFDDASGVCTFNQGEGGFLLGIFCSKVNLKFQKLINPTLNIQPDNLRNVPLPKSNFQLHKLPVNDLINQAKLDWNTYETSWDFTVNPLIQLHSETPSFNLAQTYQAWWDNNQATIAEMQRLEEENNRLFIEAYGLQEELTPDVPLEEITLTVNPKYRYGGNASDEDLAKRFQSDTVCELMSYAIGCMMGRYSLNRAGLVYAHSGNDGFAGLVNEGAYQTFPADEDGIIPITDEEWFADDATNRLVEFVKTVWSEAQLSENLSFIAESLCLHALKPKASESPLETIRRYLSNQFYKDHMRIYKKRPIYWLFSSGKQKAFECVVYLHRYNDATLSRMRTEYVIPLMGKYQAHAEQLQNQIEQADTTAQANKAKKALTTLEKKQHELTEFDEKLKNFADMRIALDLDDGVKVNYGKFGDLLVDVKGITGKKA